MPSSSSSPALTQTHTHAAAPPAERPLLPSLTCHRHQAMLILSSSFPSRSISHSITFLLSAFFCSLSLHLLCDHTLFTSFSGAFIHLGISRSFSVSHHIVIRFLTLKVLPDVLHDHHQLHHDYTLMVDALNISVCLGCNIKLIPFNLKLQMRNHRTEKVNF